MWCKVFLINSYLTQTHNSVTLDTLGQEKDAVEANEVKFSELNWIWLQFHLTLATEEEMVIKGR